MRSELAIIFACAISACVPEPDRSRPMDAVPIPVLLPDGRAIGISVSVAPARAVASPEALRQYIASTFWPLGTRAEIESRQSLPDGFATTFAVWTGDASRRSTCVSRVLRQVGGTWTRCTAKPVIDDVMRDHAIAHCRARPRR